MTKAGGATAIRLLEATAAGRDADLVDHLARLINCVYADAERGLWRNGTTRTTAAEVAALILAGQLVVAVEPDGHIVGSVRVHDVGDASEFGMLVAAHDRRGTGVGRALVDFAEQRTRERGLRAVQLELLVPRTWRHATKEFLRAWYERRGYRAIGTRSMDAVYPSLAPLLATPCDLIVYEKPL